MNDMISFNRSELDDAVLAIQQPRSNYQLAHFIVGQHDTEPRRWWQCVLELSLKLDAIERATIGRRQLERKIKSLRNGGDEAKDQAAILALDLRAQNLAVIGAIREVEALYAIFKSFPRGYTREELDAAEAEYWQKRLTRQASQELIANGRVGVGNQESLHQIGMPVTLEFVRQIEKQLCIPPSPEQSESCCTSVQLLPATSPTDAPTSPGSSTQNGLPSATPARCSGSGNA